MKWKDSILTQARDMAATLADGWDSYGAKAPGPGLAAFETLVSSLPDEARVMPFVAPVSGGFEIETAAYSIGVDGFYFELESGGVDEGDFSPPPADLIARCF